MKVMFSRIVGFLGRFLHRLIVLGLKRQRNQNTSIEIGGINMIKDVNLVVSIDKDTLLEILKDKNRNYSSRVVLQHDLSNSEKIILGNEYTVRETDVLVLKPRKGGYRIATSDEEIIITSEDAEEDGEE